LWPPYFRACLPVYRTLPLLYKIVHLENFFSLGIPDVSLDGRRLSLFSRFPRFSAVPEQPSQSPQDFADLLQFNFSFPLAGPPPFRFQLRLKLPPRFRCGPLLLPDFFVLFLCDGSLPESPPVLPDLSALPSPFLDVFAWTFTPSCPSPRDP